MIAFDEFVLENGLKVIVHQDHTTPFAIVNILYKVGSRDENPDKTGFAHLFEHFMFEGSVNVSSFDPPLQFAGGENNAFTSNDITNYYDIVPAANLETALWLESDRMLSLDFDTESLETQKKVVCEEFKEHYINQPYGDVWHKLSALSYKVHPYQWPTIGKVLAHVEDAKMQDAKDFFYQYYRPNNAVLVIAGNVDTAEVKALVNKWFGDIPRGKDFVRHYAEEPAQTAARVQDITADVPSDAIYKAYNMCARLHPDYHTTDLLRDILATGDSSRLYQQLVKEKKIFSTVTAYLSETIDAGLFIIEGKLNPNVSMQEADKAIEEITQSLMQPLEAEELQKVKNKMETYLVFSDTNVLNRATNLAYFEMLGDASLIQHETEKYLAVTAAQIATVAGTIFRKENCNTLRYFKK